MMNISSFDLSSAAANFSLSQGPIFLASRLKADPTATGIATEIPPEAIISELKKALAQPPKDTKSAVKPYVYLVALSQIPDIGPLREALNLAAPYSEWYQRIANFLFDQYRPVTRNILTGAAATIRPVTMQQGEPIISPTKITGAGQ